jgi:hypothetical protein
MKCYKESRNLAEANITCLCSLIQNKPWSEVFWEKDVSIKWDTFYTTFDYYLNIASPKVRRNIIRAVKVPWINKDIVIAKKQLKDLYNIYRLSQIQEYRDAYKICKNEYNSIIRTSKANYIQNIIND